MISQKFKNDLWDLRNLIDMFKRELLLVRDVMPSEKNAKNDVPKYPFFIGHSLPTHSQEKEKSLKPKSRPGNCDYCDDKRHVSSRLNVITNAETMKNLKVSDKKMVKKMKENVLLVYQKVTFLKPVKQIIRA